MFVSSSPSFLQVLIGTTLLEETSDQRFYSIHYPFRPSQDRSLNTMYALSGHFQYLISAHNLCTASAFLL